jgi:iron complex outermembrane receptor protein
MKRTQSVSSWRTAGGLALTSVLALATPAVAEQRPADVIQLSLEDLLKVEVTSVSRKPQSLISAPAAIFVITAEDIRRSAATTLPELLRIVPGVQVARYTNSKWAVSARGMGTYYSSKLLVLVDGRTVYTPDFAGVYWDLQDLPLEDVDRIEVIRGPGGTMWGANAVNGVINVITKPAAATTGVKANVSSGTDQRVISSFRYGSPIGAGTTYRVFGRISDRTLDTLPDTDDTSRLARGGFRLDRSAGADTFRLQGEIYDGHERTPISLPTLAAPYRRIVHDRLDLRGANVVGQWTRTFSLTNNVTIGAYADRNVRNEYIHPNTTDRADVDIAHHIRLGARHDVVWGGEARITHSLLRHSDVMVYEPERSTRGLLSAFGQDEIAVHPKLAVTLGSKVEWHQGVGGAFEPNVRVLWKPVRRQSAWGAVSHAERTPSLADQIATFQYIVVPPSAATSNLPVRVDVVGQPGVQLESVTAYEAGYRVQILDSVAIDLTAYRNQYDHLNSYGRSAPTLQVAGVTPYLYITSLHENLAAGRSHGAEALANWTATPWWTLSASTTVLDVHVWMTDATVTPGNSLMVLQYNPRRQMTARSLLDRGPFEFDATLLHNGPLQAGDVKGYTTLDVRAAWNLTRAIKVDVGAQNLFDQRHVETTRYLYEVPAEVGREFFTRITWGL